MNGDLMRQSCVVSLMLSSRNVREWNDNIDKVMGANGGVLPGFWEQAIILSGVMTDMGEKFMGGD